MTTRFQNFMPFIFKWEGGYDNDPDDPGGETNFGIDKRSHPGEDIKHLTKERAAEIYFSDYWTPLRCEELPKGVGEVVMNIGVNAGKGRAARWLQEECGATVDGQIGPQTIDHACRTLNLAEALLDRTEGHYRSIAKGKLAKFLKGWLNRNNDLRALVSK